MTLLRLTGKGGTHIYDSEIWTNEEARQDYMGQTGHDPEGTNEYAFDALDGRELVKWVQTGETN